MFRLKSPLRCYWDSRHNLWKVCYYMGRGIYKHIKYYKDRAAANARMANFNGNTG